MQLGWIRSGGHGPKPARGGHDGPRQELHHRTEIAWASLELSERGSENHRACAEVIGQGWAAEEHSKLRDSWRMALLARAEEFAPADAARLLTQAFSQEKDAVARGELAVGLAAVATHWSPPRLLARARQPPAC